MNLGHGKFTIILFMILKLVFHPVFSGHMYYPLPWHASNDCGPEKIPSECEYDLMVPVPGLSRNIFPYLLLKYLG